jgi:hypothetical protein
MLRRLADFVDFVCCLGGDGVILHASMLFRSSIPPVLSFHLGSMGFLTNHLYDDYKKALREVGSRPCACLYGWAEGWAGGWAGAGGSVRLNYGGEVQQSAVGRLVISLPAGIQMRVHGSWHAGVCQESVHLHRL